jgi:hypothetical protein
MYSATAQMISQNQATAAAIAAKLTQTEGVEYSVVKETKGFRVVKTGKPVLKTPEDAPLVSAVTAPKAVANPPTGAVASTAQVLPFGDEYHVTCELRSETPTMIKAAIAGQPRAFEKKYLLGWGVEQAQEGKPAIVTMKMTEAQAKKWKLK